MRRLVLWGLAGALFCGCVPSLQQGRPNVFVKKANIADGYYYHPTWAFSFKAPEMGYGLEVDEKSTGSGFLVAFSDIYGGLVRVEVADCNDETMEAISHDILKYSYAKTLKMIFFSIVMAPIEKAFDGIQYIEERVENIDGVGEVYLALVNIPGASTLADAATGKRADSKRAYLVSLEDNQILALSAQDSLPMQNARRDGETEELFNRLINLRKSYRKG